MMFKKGSFEIGGDVYPVAIKASLLTRYLLLASAFQNGYRLLDKYSAQSLAAWHEPLKLYQLLRSPLSH